MSNINFNEVFKHNLYLIGIYNFLRNRNIESLCKKLCLENTLTRICILIIIIILFVLLFYIVWH